MDRIPENGDGAAGMSPLPEEQAVNGAASDKNGEENGLTNGEDPR